MPLVTTELRQRTWGITPMSFPHHTSRGPNCAIGVYVRPSGQAAYPAMTMWVLARLTPRAFAPKVAFIFFPASVTSATFSLLQGLATDTVRVVLVQRGKALLVWHLDAAATSDRSTGL